MNLTKCAQRVQRLKRLGLRRRDPRCDMNCLICEPPPSVTLQYHELYSGKTELEPGLIQKIAQLERRGSKCES